MAGWLAGYAVRRNDLKSQWRAGGNDISTNESRRAESQKAS